MYIIAPHALSAPYKPGGPRPRNDTKAEQNDGAPERLLLRTDIEAIDVASMDSIYDRRP